MDTPLGISAALRRAATAVVAVLVAIVALPACSSDGPDLTVYSGRSEDLIGPIIDRYEEETGLEVAVRYADSAELALLIQTEEDQDGSPADVFISQSPGPVAFLDQAGLLAELPEDVLALAPVEARAPDGTWVGLTARQRVLVYNEELVDVSELPASVMDLTDEAYAGRVAVAPSNGSFQDFVTIMRQRLGDDETLAWLEGMAANGSPTYPNNNAIVEAVGRGEVPMGLVNHYYNVRALEEDPDLPSRNHLFDAGDAGASFIVTAATVLESSDHQDQAAALIEWLLGEEAQTYFSEETKEYPVAAGVAPPEELGAFDLTRVEAIDFDELGGDLETTIELIESSGLNT